MTSYDPEYIIPTWDNGEWTTMSFDTRSDFIEFLIPLFKEPGKYEFDEGALMFNEEARKFKENGEVYSLAPYMSKDFINYWNDQKDKCRKGVIFKNGEKTWYLPRDYYMWLNFLPIFDKEKKNFDFAGIRDAQYHMALYECLAELNYKHCSILKKRQIASSYFHMAKLINQIWFEPGVILKLGASLKDYIGLEGSWKFLDEYRAFLNSKTAWYRPMNPGKVLTWQQKIEVTENGRKQEKGLKGMLQGMSFEQSDTKGVGGPCSYFFYEEAGIAPTMDKTFEYLRPAMQSGELTTGLFICAGSVGDLSQCKPLEEFTRKPDANGMFAVESNLIDETGLVGRTGLFIPEQWSMKPYIDVFGNSLVDAAVAGMLRIREEWKRDLSPELYQLRISQHPMNIKEAFAFRDESIFPLLLVGSQKRKIEDKEYPYEFIELERMLGGGINPKPSRRQPIMEFPVDKKREDKKGVIIVYERPVPDSKWGTYYASVDPVGEGKTTTSESLCSIYVYKNPVEVTRITDRGVENHAEGDQIVAAWCGRYDDLGKTHEQLELIIEWYNAWTIVENNVSLFIQYMIERRKQKYLVPKSQIVFLKDIGANKTVYSDYGWKNTGTIFKSHLLSYLIGWLTEEVSQETDKDGTVTKVTYGIERLPDYMALVEMEQYRPGVNVDRLVSLAALIAFAKVQQSNRGYSKRVDDTRTKNLHMSDNLYKLNSTPFRHMGNKKGGISGNRLPRIPYRKLK